VAERELASPASAMHAGVGEKLKWQRDRVFLDDLVFRLEYTKNDDWDLGNRCFMFYKSKELVDQYLQFWNLRGRFPIEHIVEIGIHDGGSVVFWFEHFRPKKHVAIDLLQRDDSEYFKWYVASRGLQDRLKTYWGVDQADEERLRGIVRREFSAPLDLIVDDASHLYAPTRKSFETLFPLLRQGGLYIIEDWQWGYDPHWTRPDSPFATEIVLSKLVVELLEAVGSSRGVIASLIAYGGFVAVERGARTVAPGTPFKVRDEILRYPSRRFRARLKHAVARVKMRIPPLPRRRKGR
jgi:methyltransferase family protein